MSPSAGRFVLALLGLPPLALTVAAPVIVGVAHPWSLVLAALTCIVALLPLVWLHRRGLFDAFSPLGWCTWFFFIPAFGVGGIVAALGFTPEWVMQRIPDPSASIALTQWYLLLGVASLGAGFLVPGTARIGRQISLRLPKGAWTPGEVVLPGLLMLAAGVGLTLVAFRMGLIGYQGAITGQNLGVTVYFFSLSWMLADVLLWGAIFRPGLSGPVRAGLGTILVLLIPIHMFLTASRATPVMHLIALALAFNYSGRRITPRHVVTLGLLGCLALATGVLYGTAFRRQKTLEAIAAGAEVPPTMAGGAPAPAAAPDAVDAGSPAAPPPPAIPAAPSAVRLTPGEAPATLQQQQDLALRAGGQIAERGLAGNARFVLRELAARLEHVGSVATIVANHERLRGEEERLGLTGNILRWTWSGFVPRVVWRDKPAVGDPRPYAALYMGFGGSSAPPTPVSDLLRNFGPTGIPIGMFVLGLALRLMHSALVAGERVPLGRTVVYYALLMRLNMEGFYGTLLPDVLRAGFAAVVACVMVAAIVQVARVAWPSRA